MSIKKIFALLLAVAMLAAMLVSCNDPNNGDQTTPDSNEQTPTPITLSNVKLIAGDTAIENFAVAELNWYFAAKNITVSDSGYPITLKIDSSVAAEGGYKMEATENGLTIAGGNERGLAYAVYSFLDDFVGVHFFAADTVIVDDGEATITTGVMDEFDPAFEILRNPWYPIERLAQKDGGNTTENRFSKTLTLGTLTGNGGVAQPCLTDPENLPRAIKYVRNYLASAPGVEQIAFAPNASSDLYCQCPNCARIDNEEGSHAGSYIRFINAIIEDVSPDFPNVKYEINIRTYLQKAPALTKPAGNTSVRLSTAGCCINHPLTDADCENSVAFTQSLSAWSELCQSVHLEYVLTSTTDYIPVFANFGSLRQNMRFFAESGIKSVYCSGNFACPSGEFGELRVYLISKLLVDPMMSEEEYYAYMDSFLKGFYGEGWEYIRKFIDKVIELAADGHQTISDSALLAVTADEYYENRKTFDEWWNKAEELAGDRIDFVKRARYQWRYVKLLVRPDSLEAQKLINDVTNPKARVAWREKQWNVDMSSDLFASPDQWIYKS